jgi:hypothetical protein
MGTVLVTAGKEIKKVTDRVDPDLLEDEGTLGANALNIT